MVKWHELRWFYDIETEEFVLMDYWGDSIWCEGKRQQAKLGKAFVKALKERMKRFKRGVTT